ncbi:MAG TPA: ATPase, T2SS/T4P/T4SS family, partial [Polyangiaceae bacterium]|nr:ATPase, T2SS/T4P/T4SS family [Polyangiaceae bacterium]
MNVEIVIERDNGERRVERLLGSGPLSVGRNADCSVCVPDQLISRRHALLHLSKDVLRVEDVSSNGTLAGDRLLLREAADVPYGTPILIGIHTLYVRPTGEQALPANEPLPSALPSPPPTLLPPVPPAPPPAGRPQLSVVGAPRPLAEAPTAAPVAPAAARTEAVVLAEPATEREAPALRREIHRRLLQHLDLATTDGVRLDDPSFRPKVLTALRRIVRALHAELPPGFDADRLVGELADEALGLGPLEQLLADPSISEIMVIDADTIYVERNGKVVRTAARFTDDDRVRAVIERIVTPLGRRIDESSPLVDARLPDGSRVNAIIRPLALKGSCITIRKFAKVPLTLEKLYALGALTPAIGQFLTRSVIAKKNIVISGGTGSGKTTLLNVLSSAIPSDERIVTIEDSAELQLGQPHVVALETRPANMEGKGDYTIRDLVK